MTFHQLAVLIAKKEAKKKQVNIAQIKEVLKVLRELVGADLACLVALLKAPKR